MPPPLRPPRRRRLVLPSSPPPWPPPPPEQKEAPEASSSRRPPRAPPSVGLLLVLDAATAKRRPPASSSSWPLQPPSDPRGALKEPVLEAVSPILQCRRVGSSGKDRWLQRKFSNSPVHKFVHEVPCCRKTKALRVQMCE
ncbi:hypothetical protein BRADI_4g11621v3 [Brachypodium distachyon]|uniref:Uncharacterized protein n=1 Tax=Brachypodium distachyon TaxID=15368 RepID=A0A0Q3PE37_BRADI|nr:hypothetical protein BRADI_4g11621v3 [Brachypodium distachyon]